MHLSETRKENSISVPICPTDIKREAVGFVCMIDRLFQSVVTLLRSAGGMSFGSTLVEVQ